MTMDPVNNVNFFFGSYSGQIFQHVGSSQAVSKTRLSMHKKILGESNSFESGAVTQLDYYPFFEPYLLAGEGWLYYYYHHYYYYYYHLSHLYFLFHPPPISSFSYLASYGVSYVIQTSFLGYDDGFIRIFAVGKSSHLLSFCFKRNIPFLQIKWSRSHPSIFFSLDVEGNLCVWNVLTNIYRPVQVEHLPGYIGFDISSDSKWQIKDKSSTNIKARLLLWALDGRIEVHDLSDAFSNPDLDAGFKMCSLFQSML